MNIKVLFLIVIIVPVLFFFGCLKSTTQESGTWKGHVEHEEGIPVMKNPAEPLFGEFDFELEEDLSIGDEEEDNFFFYNAYQMAVDSAGNIFVADSGNHRIQKFDHEGRFLQSIGRKGQGPGEFEYILGIYLDPNDAIYISGKRKLHLFNPEGIFIKDIPLPSNAYALFTAQDNSFFAKIMAFNPLSQDYKISHFDDEGKELQTIFQRGAYKTVTRKSKSGGITSFSAWHDFSPDMVLTSLTSGQLVYGWSQDYRLFKINDQGQPLLFIDKTEPAHSITQKEKNKIIQETRESLSSGGQGWPDDVIEEACQFPAHRPYFNGILSDDKGRIYVRRVSSNLDESKEVLYDIFSIDGHYLYQNTLPFTPDVIRNGYLYYMDIDDKTGFTSAKRYKILNWGAFKSNVSK